MVAAAKSDGREATTTGEVGRLMSDNARLSPAAAGDAAEHPQTGEPTAVSAHAPWSFAAYLVTQFLGAVNDNMFRWLVVPIAKYRVGPSGEALALSAGLASFVLPYILLASPAGWLADRFSKRTVIVGCKVAEVLIMALGIVAILWGNLAVLFLVVALMGAQSALFGPSKMGVIPELVRSDRISWANGLVGLSTVVAVVLGTIAGNLLFTVTGPDGLTRTWVAAAALVGVAGLGWLASLGIRRVSAAAPERPFPVNAAADTWGNLRLLGSDRALLRVALGVMFFWSLAALAQLNVDVYTIQELHLTQAHVGPLLGILALGVGIGSVLAGLWSGGTVELGIVPLGAVGIAVSAMLLSTTVDSYTATAVLLFLLGASGGLFDVPLAAFLQHRSPREARGSILAASNFLTFTGMLIVSGVFVALRSHLELDASDVFLVAGAATVPVALYIVLLLPGATLRFLVWLLSHTAYRVRVYGRENIPETGGAVLVPNHVSWIDGVLLLISSSRPIRMLAYAGFWESRATRWLARLFGVILIKPEAGPKSIARALETARQAVLNGELVCVFPEGEITRIGQMLPFRRGVLKIVEGTEAPVIPTCLDGLWDSIFSYRGGRVIWKRPRRWPLPVRILFGTPLFQPRDVFRMRRAVQDLSVQAADMRKSQQMIPPRMFVRECRRSLFRRKIADSTGTELTGGRLLAGSVALARVLSRRVLADDERMVGILLPPSAGGVLANAAVTLLNRVAVNLNYTLTENELNHCIADAGVRHVLTSRRFLEKRPLKLDAEFVFLEDLREQVGRWDRIVAFCQAYLLPACIFERLYGLHRRKPDDLMTVIFTSGSTGEPKGVMLSYDNVGSNIDAADQLLQIEPTDVLLGVLPFFHSFGYTLNLWLVLTKHLAAVFHFNPVDSRQIGKLCEKYGTTIITATPTFLKHYLKRCTPEQFRTVDVVLVGAEKMPLDLAHAFHEKFGIWPSEGYGTTELSPLVAVNVPDHRARDVKQKGTKLGTVGRPIPNIAVKIVDPDTGEELPPGREGLLWIKGPNVMQGYLNRPEQTAEVLQDGWYNTGDIARIDEDGFIEITGRLSRFSKIGGEMVPHLRIEQELERILEDPQDEEAGPHVAVTSVADPKKGERIVVLHRPLRKPVDEVLRKLGESGLPNLWLPSADSFVEVPEIPILGSGKLDLKQIRQVAEAAFAARQDQNSSERQAPSEPADAGTGRSSD